MSTTAYNKQYYIENREAIRDRQNKKSYQRKYGISYEEYEQMLTLQDNACLICGVDMTHGRSSEATQAHVDHCHTTGKVRGVLCARCNKGLGFFRDNIASLAAAIKYLEDSQ